MKNSEIKPYIVSTTRSSASIDYAKVNKLGIAGIMLEAGYLYDALHISQRNFQNPKLKEQTAAADAANVPYGLYIYARARTVEEAKLEMAELALVLFKYPPRLGVWLKLNLSSFKYINNDIMKTYYAALVNNGFKGQVGIQCTRKQLDQISWETFCSSWYLWLDEPLKDISQLPDNISPELFII